MSTKVAPILSLFIGLWKLFITACHVMYQLKLLTIKSLFFTSQYSWIQCVPVNKSHHLQHVINVGIAWCMIYRGGCIQVVIILCGVLLEHVPWPLTFGPQPVLMHLCPLCSMGFVLWFCISFSLSRLRCLVFPLLVCPLLLPGVTCSSLMCLIVSPSVCIVCLSFTPCQFVLPAFQARYLPMEFCLFFLPLCHAMHFMNFSFWTNWIVSEIYAKLCFWTLCQVFSNPSTDLVGMNKDLFDSRRVRTCPPSYYHSWHLVLYQTMLPHQKMLL